ncbi:MAG TPA: response regulator [Gemmataceae bacterium]
MRRAVLIADGDVSLLKLFESFLSRHGYAVDTAGDTLDCLGKLRRCHYQLLVLDLELPWGGGEAVLAVMRGDPPRVAVPVLLTSAGVFPEGLPAPVRPPAVRVLWKPFSLELLLESVQSALAADGPVAAGDNP